MVLYLVVEREGGTTVRSNVRTVRIDDRRRRSTPKPSRVSRWWGRAKSSELQPIGTRTHSKSDRNYYPNNNFFKHNSKSSSGDSNAGIIL
jgi:hypothetical protein